MILYPLIGIIYIIYDLSLIDFNFYVHSSSTNECFNLNEMHKGVQVRKVSSYVSLFYLD